jgi:hypothetical protein
MLVCFVSLTVHLDVSLNESSLADLSSADLFWCHDRSPQVFNLNISHGSVYLWVLVLFSVELDF